MRSLKDYNLPEPILHIEQKLTLQEIAVLVDGSIALESNEEQYVEAFKKMLHFEEAAESRFLVQFNAENIRLRNVSGPEFCIPIDASEKKIDNTNQRSTNPTTSFSSPFFLL